MPVRPSKKTLSAAAPAVLNAIRNSATQNYRDFVPYASTDAESVREIGTVIMQYPALQNEFLQALVQRIAKVIISSKLYSNPWAFVKRGYLELGETVEEIFVGLVKPFEYDPAVAETDLFKREMPDVKAAFHVVNYRKFYKVTVEEELLRGAFTSWDGVSNLISRIIEQCYTAAEYDEFLVMKYLLARHMIAGHLAPIEIKPITDVTARQAVTTIKAISNDMTFMKRKYNMAGVRNYSDKNDQYLFVNAKYDAFLDVEVLAAAFNMNKVEFAGHKVLVDSFGDLDLERLRELFRDDPTYNEPTADELKMLDAVPVVMVDRNFFMIFDNLNKFTDADNAQGLYWQYFYHQWKLFSVSPFANAVMFTQGKPAVTSVTVSPAAVTAAPGQIVSFSADVTTENFAPMAVDWSISDDSVSIDNSGSVKIPGSFTGTLTITATSRFDPSKSATATLTVA